MLNPRKLSQDPIFKNLLPRDRFVLLRSPLDELDPAQRNGTASLDAVAAALATRFAVGGAPQWVLGNDYKEGAFTYDKGLTYRAKQDVASSQLAPGGDPDNFEVVGPVPRYAIVTLPNAQAARAARTVTPGRLDGITGDWNAAGLDETVYVHGVWFDAYHKLGVVYDAQGASQLVEVDVTAGTYKKLTGSQLTADQVAALQVSGANATNQFVLSSDLNGLTSRFYGLSDLPTLLQRYIIRWDQEKAVTLNQDFEGRLRYTSGQAFAFTSGTYAAGIIRLSADDYGRRGDLVGVRIQVGSKDLVYEAGAAEAFHSSGGPRTLPALAGYQYIFHLVRPDPNTTAGSYWVVHTMPSTSTSGGAPGAATSVDYNSELVYTQATTLTAAAAYKSHVFTGNAPFTLTLPAASTCTGKLLAVRVRSTAQAVFMVAAQGSDLINSDASFPIWTQESLTLLSTGTGWTKVSSRLRGMSADIALEVGANVTIGPDQYQYNYRLPLTRELIPPTPGMHMAGTGLIRIQRSARYLVAVRGRGDFAAGNYKIEPIIFRNQVGSQDFLCPPGTTDGSTVAILAGSMTMQLNAGDELAFAIYCGNSSATIWSDASRVPQHVAALLVTEIL